MKRTFSEEIETGLNKRSKIIKIRDGLFEFFGLNKFDEEPVVFPDNANKYTNNDHTANISTRPVITGNQFKDLYERSIRGDEVPLQSFLKTINTTNDVSMLESTKFNNQSILQSLVNDKENGSSKPLEKQVTLPKRSHSPDSTSASVTTATKFVKQPNGIKQMPQQYRATFNVDPLERARLIQLKKRMETDKVRKARLRFLRKHSQNLIQVNHTRNSKTPGYIDTAVETISYNPRLSTLNDDGSNTTTSKILQVDEIPENKKNKTGWFVLDPYVSDEEEDNSENNFGKIDQGKPLIEKIKFPPKKIDNLSPATAPPKFDVATKPKSFLPTKSDYAKIENKAEIKISKNMSKAPYLASTQDAEEENNISSIPSSAFSFAQDSSFPSKPTNGTPVPKFSINGDTTSLKEDKKPTFSLDTAEQPILSITTDKKETAPPAPVKAFSFGSNSPTEKKDESKSLFGKSKDGKPSFSFGGSTPTLNFDSTDNKIKEKKTVPSFSFGSISAKVDDSSKPTTSFGMNGSSSTSTDETKKPAVPSFSFGLTSEKKHSSSAPPTAPVVLSFGSSTSTDNKNVSSPQFTFGSNISETTNDSKPTISFGTSEKKDEPSKPSFSFGASSDKAPSLTFGKTTENKSNNVSKVSFGSTPSVEEKPDSAQSIFTFGATSSKPTTNNTITSPPLTGEKDSSSSKPIFSFGSNTSEKEDDSTKSKFSTGTPVPSITSASKPSFTGFGSNATNATVEKKDEAAKPSFSFGAISSQGSAFGGLGSTSTNGFSFGTTTPSKENNSADPNKISAFNLDASKVSSSAFGEQKVNNNSKFSFGVSKNNDTPSQAISKPATGFGGSDSGFKFGSSSAKPSFSFGNNNDGKPANSSGDNKAFGFGSGSGSAPSNGSSIGDTNGSVFGNNSNTSKPSGFSGFGGFGGSQTNPNGTKPMFGGNSNGEGASMNGNSAFGLNGAVSSLSNPNSKESTPGFGAQSQQGSKMFNFGSVPNMPQPPNSGFNFGGTSSVGNVNNQQQGFNLSRSATPNFNFTGQQQTSLDPSSIFSNSTPSNGTPPPNASRKKIKPRALMRGGRR